MANRTFLLGLMMLVGMPLYAAETTPLRDPLRPLGYQGGTSTAKAVQSAAKIAEWHLGAVLVSAERSVAVINGQSLQIGDLLEGYKLVEIQSDKVLLQKKRKKLVLRRAGIGIKKALSSQSVVKGSRP